MRFRSLHDRVMIRQIETKKNASVVLLSPVLRGRGRWKVKSSPRVRERGTTGARWFRSI